MATKKTSDSSVIADADAPLRTPENTPKPGGGSWHWDAQLCDWAENGPYAPPAEAIGVDLATDPAAAPVITTSTV